ncbi:MAG TPA: hypothetical protein VMQ73_12980, partial [Methylomirabilota bacterium]|nr:hypothetical protein [Methylomirabilota bacterium]
MTATTTSLAQQIQQAVNSGQQPAIALSDLLAQPSELTGPIHVVVIDVSTLLAGLTDVYKIAAVLPGLPIGQWLPKQDFLAPFFNNVVNLVSVTFTVDANAKALISISLELTLGAGGAGVTLATDIISATVQSLDVTFYPDTPSLTVITIGGSLTINKTLTLDTALSCPSLAFAATIPPGQVIPFSDLLGAFGLDCPAALQPLELTTLDLDFAVRDRSAYLQLALDTANRTPLPIIPNVLALDNLNMELSRAPSGVDASVAAELTVVNKIVVGVLVAGGTGQPWTITGNMDVAQTAANFGKSQVELGDLLAAAINVTLPSQLASFLDTIAIELLDGTVTLGSPITWSLGLEVSVDWSLGGGTFTADTTVTVGNDGTSNTGNIAADLRIGETDGPGLSLQINYDCSSSNNQNITFILPQLGISIPYTVGSNQLTITFNPQQGGPQTLGDLVGDIVEIFTGNPYVVLPSPWSDVLNEIPLPAMTLTVDLATKKVAISLVTNISFFGNTITGVTLGYDPTQPAGDRLTFRLDGSFPVLGIENPTWDPTNPAAAPAVPGQGSKLIDIQLVAAGQRVVLQLPQNPTVEDAVSAIATIAKNAGGSDPNKLPSFDPGAGWLVGTHIVFKSALDFQFVFADPVIYGAVIKVAKQPDSPPAIAALDGLYVEILYRKVSSSIGVYEGMLTLPDKIRKIDYGAFLLQLPSISLDIYTNGDFLIDVGFPHNGDFSKSAVINAGQYIGAGGVYYGHLSGATASALPTVPQVTDYYQNQVPIGTFNTVTEIGIGLRVGFGKSFSSGPLSASVSVVIQAIFEGVFSNFTQFELQIKDPSTNPPQLWHPEYPVTTEYYSITASLGIVGQLQGTIDFAIISASLLVQISIIATVQAESYKAVQVGAEVSVDVELTVSINLGIFSIHIHCSFSTTVSVSTQFGSNAQTVPWGQQQQLSHLRAQMLAAAAPLQLNFNTPPCQNVAISLYVLPQLSRSLVDVTNQSGAVDWVYALQFALPVAAPASGAQGTFADFAQFVTAWAVDAAWPHTGSPTTPAAFYASLTIDGTKHYDPLSDQWRSKIDDLIDALKAILHGGAPANFDTSLQQFFAQGQFTLVAGSASDNGASFGFFPILPPLQLAATGGTMQQGVSGVANNVLRAYALMVATTVLNAIGKKITGLSTLAAAYTALGADGLNGAVGMATRFMLHGTRYAVTSSQLVPVYLATGQELAVDTTAAALTVTVTGPQGATYGVTVPAGGLTLSSAQQQLHPQSDINTYVTGVTTTSVSATTMSAGLLGPVRYSVKNGPVAPLSLRGLPTALMSLAGNPANFALYLTQQDGTETPVPASAWGWCSAINFRVQKVPDPSSPGNNLADVYTLVAVQTDGLARLEALYQAYGTASPTTLEIVYGANANQTTSGNTSPPTFVTVTPQSIFLFQSNISTETNPPRITLMLARAAAAGTDPNLTFLGRLLTGGLTNSGGYFLYLKLSSGSLPDAMFDSRGMAWLTLAVSGFNTTAVAPYFSALRISDQTYAGTAALTLQSPDVTALQPTIASGFVGVQISRPDWSNEDDSKYQRSLDGLFNLIDCIPTALQPVPSGANWSILPGSDQVVGPIKTDATTSTTHIYNAQFDLLAITGQQPDVYPNPPKDAASPYQFAGAQLGLGFAWVDFYGDTLPPGFSGGPLAIGLVDPLLGLDDWPGLSYGFTVTPGPGGPLLIVSMTYIPSEDGTQLDKPAWQQYVKIYHQLATVSLSAQASF